MSNIFIKASVISSVKQHFIFCLMELVAAMKQSQCVRSVLAEDGFGHWGELSELGALCPLMFSDQDSAPCREVCPYAVRCWVSCTCHAMETQVWISAIHPCVLPELSFPCSRPWQLPPRPCVRRCGSWSPASLPTERRVF